MGRFDGMNESNQSSSLPTCYGNLPPTTHSSSQTSPHIIFQNVRQEQPSTSNAVFNPIFEHTSDGSSLESSYLG
ncbi:unnamed protein product [Macrosiphum euphorbiae]|uniref:Uncharacterized protein n=1 Tax=Macrosiphum euphorbiae TaxID=13131 RepID=A0AAV0XIR6_9HEMI|nr:unnamed protein product [Macrosiphum euphorbiae]